MYGDIRLDDFPPLQGESVGVKMKAYSKRSATILFGITVAVILLPFYLIKVFFSGLSALRHGPIQGPKRMIQTVFSGVKEIPKHMREWIRISLVEFGQINR